MENESKIAFSARELISFDNSEIDDLEFLKKPKFFFKDDEPKEYKDATELYGKTIQFLVEKCGSSVLDGLDNTIINTTGKFKKKYPNIYSFVVNGITYYVETHRGTSSKMDILRDCFCNLISGDQSDLLDQIRFEFEKGSSSSVYTLTIEKNDNAYPAGVTVVDKDGEPVDDVIGFLHKNNVSIKTISCRFNEEDIEIKDERSERVLLHDVVDIRFIQEMSDHLSGASDSDFPINWNDDKHNGIYLSHEYPFTSTNEICRFDFPAKRNPKRYIYNGHDYSMYCWKWSNGIPFIKECLKLFGKDGDKYVIRFVCQKAKDDNKQKKKDFDLPGKSIIFYGPPGTGKTREAKKLAGQIVANDKNGLNDKDLEKYINNGRIKLVQFHPSYSYEDFVRGVTVTPKDGDVFYKIESKVFEEICDSANDDSDKNNYVIIIDEINRAPLSTVLGELIYGIEYRGKSINSPYSIVEEGSGEKGIVVPENLYIIGTMNTADRTIGSLDYAVRRRFDFKPVYAQAIGEDTEGIVTNVNDHDRKQIFLKASFETVFRDVSLSVARGIDPNDIMPGGSYFLVNAVDSDDGIDWDHYDYKMKYELLPLLQEYSKDGMFTSRKSIDGKETLIELLRDNRYFEKLENAEKHFQRKIYYKVRSDVSKAMNEGVSLDDLMPDTECFIGEKASVINSVCIQLSSLNKCWKRSKIDEMNMKQYLDDNGKEYKERLKAIT